MNTQQLPASEAIAQARGERPERSLEPIRLKRQGFPPVEIEALDGSVVTYQTRAPTTDEVIEAQASVHKLKRVSDPGELRDAVGVSLGFFLVDPDGFLAAEEPEMALEVLERCVTAYVGSKEG